MHRIQYYKKRTFRNILVEKYGLIYFKQYKVASSTILIQLAQFLSLPEKGVEYIHFLKKYPFPSASKEDIETKYKDFVRFTIVRNPWERLVSCYKNKITRYGKGNKQFFADNPQFYCDMPFEAFIEAVIQTPDHNADVHFVQQLYFLHDFEGNFLLNYIGDLHRFQEHLEAIKLKTGAPFTSSIRINPTKKDTYESYYTTELVEKVRWRFEKDIDFFGYEFGKNNDCFPFGFLSQKQYDKLNTPNFRLWILQEKLKEANATADALYHGMLQEREKIATFKQRIEQSKSWKITTPLRALSAMIRKEI